MKPSPMHDASNLTRFVAATPRVLRTAIEQAVASLQTGKRRAKTYVEVDGKIVVTGELGHADLITAVAKRAAVEKPPNARKCQGCQLFVIKKRVGSWKKWCFRCAKERLRIPPEEKKKRERERARRREAEHRAAARVMARLREWKSKKSERARAALARSKALDEQQKRKRMAAINKAVRLVGRGSSVAEAAEKTGVNYRVIYRTLKLRREGP